MEFSETLNKLIMRHSNTFVYFHGYGSSSKTDKVDRIKKIYPNDKVYAFDADIDPDIAIKEVGDKIFEKLVDDHSEGKLIFIGTSLGAWLANELSNEYECLAILINPSYMPRITLGNYGVPANIVKKYSPMLLTDLNRKRFYIDPLDDVIKHSHLLSILPEENVILTPGVGHRFTGPEFESMLKNIF